MQGFFTCHYRRWYCIFWKTVPSVSNLHWSLFIQCRGALKGVIYTHTHFKGCLHCQCTKQSHGGLHKRGIWAWFLYKWTSWQMCSQHWGGRAPGQLRRRSTVSGSVHEALSFSIPLSSPSLSPLPCFLYICCSTEISQLKEREDGKNYFIMISCDPLGR